MITKQLNDNNIATKMLSLVRIKELNGVIFPEVAVYLQRKTAWTLEYCRRKQLQYSAALQLALSLTFMQLGLPEVWVAALKRSTSSDF